MSLPGEGWFENFRLNRRVRRAERTRISELDIRAGSKIVGTARSEGETLRSPFTGVACVCFRVVAIRTETTGSRREELLVADEEYGREFFVEDESGLARVERRGWSRLLVNTRSFHAAWQHGSITHLEAFFERHGHASRTFFEGFDFAHSYYERVVPEGATVAVLGDVEATGELAPQIRAGGYRQAPTLMALVPGAEQRLLVTTEPRALR